LGIGAPTIRRPSFAPYAGDIFVAGSYGKKMDGCEKVRRMQI
jgi:hypothetical protein